MDMIHLYQNSSCYNKSYTAEVLHSVQDDCSGMNWSISRQLEPDVIGDIENHIYLVFKKSLK